MTSTTDFSRKKKFTLENEPVEETTLPYLMMPVVCVEWLKLTRNRRLMQLFAKAVLPSIEECIEVLVLAYSVGILCQKRRYFSYTHRRTVQLSDRFIGNSEVPYSDVRVREC